METFVFDLKQPLVELPQSPFAMRLLDNVTLEVDVAKEQSLNNLFGFLEGHHIEVTSLRNKANRLEELFLNLIAANKNK
jgi:ABC-2 type transport system ATP-binding protein